MNFNRPLFDQLQAAFKAVAYFLFALTFFEIVILLVAPFPPESWQHACASGCAISAAVFVVWKTLQQEKAARRKQSRE